jgi:hypothetical protein
LTDPYTTPLDIVFDGPPRPEGPRLVEAERDGKSVRVGTWIDLGDGTWALRLRVGRLQGEST